MTNPAVMSESIAYYFAKRQSVEFFGLAHLEERSDRQMFCLGRKLAIASGKA